jgi:hypothetical protein
VKARPAAKLVVLPRAARLSRVLNFMVHLRVLWTRECAAGLLLLKLGE